MPPATQVAPCSAKPRSVTPPWRDDGDFGGCGFFGGGGGGAGAAPPSRGAPPDRGRCPEGEMAREIAREPTGEAGALEEAQRARRGSGSPDYG